MTLLDHVQQDVELTEKRNGYEGPCPFCGGRDRFVVDERDGEWLWWCRRQCQTPPGGDLVTYLEKRDGLTTAEAMKAAGMKVQKSVFFEDMTDEETKWDAATDEATRRYRTRQWHLQTLENATPTINLRCLVRAAEKGDLQQVRHITATLQRRYSELAIIAMHYRKRHPRAFEQLTKKEIPHLLTEEPGRPTHEAERKLMETFDRAATEWN